VKTNPPPELAAGEDGAVVDATRGSEKASNRSPAVAHTSAEFRTDPRTNQ
jgi:hypothetical protein